MLRMSHHWTWLINSSECSASLMLHSTNDDSPLLCIFEAEWFQLQADVLLMWRPRQHTNPLKSHADDSLKLFFVWAGTSRPPFNTKRCPWVQIGEFTDMINMLSSIFLLSTPQKSRLTVHHVKLACGLTHYGLSYPTCTLSYYSLARDSFVQTSGRVSVALRLSKRTGIKKTKQLVLGQKWLKA